jgi:fructosamine-3-kinase
MMHRDLHLHVQKQMGEKVRNVTRCGGGDTAVAYAAELDSGQRLFVKTALKGTPFDGEALGLRRLRNAGGLRIPHVLHVDEQCLVLEYVEFGTLGRDFQQRLGAGLAQIHRAEAEAYGFDVDHVIGLSPQRNLPRVPVGEGAWAEFWWTHRLEPVMCRVRDTDLRKRLSRLEARVESILSGTGEAASLLHGDLWSGNVAADETGAPIIFDPAPYYGHREADLAMTRMFGGFTEGFYEAYAEAYPLVDGWRGRLDFYMLYHVLNHLVLFGSAYRAQAERILKVYS